MLKKHLQVLGLIFLFIPFIASASTTNCTWNTFLKQMECTTKASPQEKLDALKSQYGISAYYACFPSNCSTSSLHSDPYFNESCYLQTRFCLEQKRLREDIGNNIYNNLQKYNCPAGSVYSNGRCVTFDARCQESYGVNSIYQSANTSGGLVCGCKSGYAFNAQKTACVAQTSSLAEDIANGAKKQQETNNTACRSQYGPNSYSQNPVASGDLLCACQTGFVFNAGKTSCVSAQANTADKIRPAQQPKSTPKPETPNTVQEPTAAPETKQEEVKPEVKGELTLTRAEASKQEQPAKKPSFFRRIVNFFKNLF